MLTCSRFLTWCAGFYLSSLMAGVRLKQPLPPLWLAVTRVFALLGFLPVPPPHLALSPICLLPCWLRKAMVTCGVWLYPRVLGFLKQENQNGYCQLDVVFSFTSSPFSRHVLPFPPLSSVPMPGPSSRRVSFRIGIYSCAWETGICPGNHGETTRGDKGARSCWTQCAEPVQGAKPTGPSSWGGTAVRASAASV